MGSLFENDEVGSSVPPGRDREMGIFDFVKDAGERLFGGAAKPAAVAAAASDQAQNRGDDQVEVDRQMGMALSRLPGMLGLSVEELRVDLSNGRAIVSGRVPSQAEREKVVLAIGNNQGVAQVDDRLVVEKSEPAATLYTVQRGDTLSKIAKEHYGNAMKYPAIFEANKPMLKDPDKIYPGQTLRIPPLAE